MPHEPEFAQRYAEARRGYDHAVASGADGAALQEAKERYREALAAYVLDLQVNGMTVTDDLAAELAALE